MFIDTHAHLYAEEFDEDRNEMMQRAQDAGVTRIFLPDVDSQSRAALLEMADNFAYCYPMVGLHPTSVNENPNWQAELDQIEDLLAESASRYCAIGEIGLDLYWSQEFEAQQRAALKQQLDAALRYNLPVAIHCREAWPQLLEVLEPYADRGLRGIIHAFSGDIEIYRKLLTIGDFLFGIGGVVTFKRSALAPVVAEMSLERIALETDAPYLTPVPFRGKRNESSYIPIIAETIANLHAVSAEEVGRVTSLSVLRMFATDSAQ